MVNIAIIGYGKMGQLVEKQAERRGHRIVVRIDTNTKEREGLFNEISEENLSDTEVCIDFTHPSVAVENIRKISALGKNIVMGTTGWYSQMGDVRRLVKKHNVGCVWSGNFSLGVNAFFHVIGYAASIFDKLKEYDVCVSEYHHSKKVDSPSGTAKIIGDFLLKNIERKSTLVTERLDRPINDEEIHISSVRGGSFPGTHSISFDSDVDTIELKHTTRGREGFALGAVQVAEFINGKKGFYSIDDLMKNLINQTTKIDG